MAIKLEDYPKKHRDAVETICIIQSELNKMKRKLKDENFMLALNYEVAIKEMLELIYYGSDNV